MDSWGAVRNYTGRLDAVQVVTWHDYEEGTEIQSGIDNCLSIYAAVSGSVLSWSVNDDSTLDHYTVYISTDGQNLMSLGDFYTGTNSLNLAPYDFAPGRYYVLVKAVGKPSVKNNMSAAAIYTSGTERQPTVTISTPYNGQDAGPATNLNVGATSPNGPIVKYQVYLDGTLVRTINSRGPFQAWISTSMGRHTYEVKAEDSTGQWGSGSVWDVRTY